ncbi:nucleoside 2-deoxyribosyltransferase [uncultured Microbacterium sp.]|uniref:nucleoside 2-deoxyribosyltransferase n=1 Tax=uncultured Microbacterium sp. TaxID=191216 RepID=UPI0035CA3B4E
MSLLEGIRVLVGGPMKALFKANAFDSDMRQRVEITVSSLRSAGALVYSAHLAEKFEIARLTSVQTTARDFRWQLSCDVYVALLPVDEFGVAIPSAGTSIELGWATAFRKPVVILSDHAYTAGYSHLVRGLQAVSPVEHLDLWSSREQLISTISRMTSVSTEEGISRG